MSGLLNSSLNGSASTITDSTGRIFPSSFSAQSGTGAAAYHHTGTIQGLHNMHNNFNVPSMAGSLPSRNSTINGVPSGGIQQSTGNLLAGRFGSNNISDPLSQISHGISHGHSGITSRGNMNMIGGSGYTGNKNFVGGSNYGVLPTSAAAGGNRSAVPGLGVSPMLGSSGSRMPGSMGNVVGPGNIGRIINSGGGLSVPGLTSRLNLTSNSVSGSSGLQGPNGLTGGVLQQASPQVMSMLGNSYASGGNLLSQNHVQVANNMSSRAMLHDSNTNDNSPFGIDDFPSLGNRPNSAGGPQGQLGSIRKQGLGGPLGQRNQEFSIQNEDFPALPGFKGGSVDFGLDFRQKDQPQDNASMMQPQHFSMGRSSGFTLGGSYLSHQPQQQHQHQHQHQHMPSVSNNSDSFASVNNQRLMQSHGSDLFPPSSSAFHIQGNMQTDNSLRTMNNISSISSAPCYDQRMQQYQQPQSPSQFHLRQMPAMNQSFRDQGVQSLQAKQVGPDPFGLLGLLGVIRMSDPDLTSLALGIDLTTLGLNLNSSEDLHRSFGSPWSVEPAKGDPEFAVPRCYLEKPTPALHYVHFKKFRLETLFYIFYSMPKDEVQLYAADELHRRGWLYHKEHRIWLSKIPSLEPLVKTQTYERGSYKCFDPNTWQEIQKDNFVVQYDLIERRPVVHQH